MSEVEDIGQYAPTGAAPKAPKSLNPPLQLGGLTTGVQGTPLTAPPPTFAASPSSATKPGFGPPPMQGGMFPGGPKGPEAGGVAPTGPPSTPPPPFVGSQFLPPNFQSRLGEAGFFSGPTGVGEPAVDPMEWLRQLFGGLRR